SGARPQRLTRFAGPPGCAAALLSLPLVLASAIAPGHAPKSTMLVTTVIAILLMAPPIVAASPLSLTCTTPKAFYACCHPDVACSTNRPRRGRRLQGQAPRLPRLRLPRRSGHGPAALLHAARV